MPMIVTVTMSSTSVKPSSRRDDRTPWNMSLIPTRLVVAGLKGEGGGGTRNDALEGRAGGVVEAEERAKCCRREVDLQVRREGRDRSRSIRTVVASCGRTRARDRWHAGSGWRARRICVHSGLDRVEQRLVRLRLRGARGAAHARRDDGREDADDRDGDDELDKGEPLVVLHGFLDGFDALEHFVFHRSLSYFARPRVSSHVVDARFPTSHLLQRPT